MKRLFRTRSLTLSTASAILLLAAPLGAQQEQPAGIPLPEHPRPDFQRADWQNLNGSWDFQFDQTNQGETRGWPASGRKTT